MILAINMLLMTDIPLGHPSTTPLSVLNKSSAGEGQIVGKEIRSAKKE